MSRPDDRSAPRPTARCAESTRLPAGLGTAPAALLDGDVDALLAASFALQPAESDCEGRRRRRSVIHLTRWLAQFPGGTWQARWVATEQKHGGTPWATGALVDSAGNQVDGYNTTFLVLGVLIAIGGLVAARFVDPGRDTAHDAVTPPPG